MAWVRALHCNSVYITCYQSIWIPISICTSYFTANKSVLVDSGATDNFMHPNFAKRMGLWPVALDRPQKIWNADNTENKEGMITHYLDLDVETKGIHKDMCFYITNIDKEDIFLRYSWLAAYELHFKWKDATIGEKVLPAIIRSINPHIPWPWPVIAQATLEDLKACIIQQLKEQSCLCTTSTDLAIQAEKHTKAVKLLPQYQKFAKVFSEKESFRFPPSCPWNHMIKFKKGTPDPIDCKVYPMSQKKDEVLWEFLMKQLEKGYICPFKSPYASSFFFIDKKDGKLCPVQDYRCINNHTIHNQYPLPLITDLITDLQGAHIYMKLDIRWGYNNVRIKKGDEHKAAFKTRYGLYKPTATVCFLASNSPTTFQAMMNHIFCPVIAKHKLFSTSICVYMDDIAIATHTNDQDHTLATQDVLALAAEHDLYFKLEKCLFHIPSINDLRVILEKGVICMDPVKIDQSLHGKRSTGTLWIQFRDSPHQRNPEQSHRCIVKKARLWPRERWQQGCCSTPRPPLHTCKPPGMNRSGRTNAPIPSRRHDKGIPPYMDKKRRCSSPG